MTHAPTYTLIAYRPDGYDSCSRESTGSTFECLSFAEADKLVEAAALLRRDNTVEMRTDRSMADIEFTVLVDGLDRYAHEARHHQSEEAGQPYGMEGEFYRIQVAIQSEYERVLHEWDSGETARKNREAAERAVREQAEAERRDKALLRKLIELHGIPEELK